MTAVSVLFFKSWSRSCCVHGTRGMIMEGSLLGAAVGSVLGLPLALAEEVWECSSLSAWVGRSVYLLGSVS